MRQIAMPKRFDLDKLKESKLSQRPIRHMSETHQGGQPSCEPFSRGSSRTDPHLGQADARGSGSQHFYVAALPDSAAPQSRRLVTERPKQTICSCSEDDERRNG